MFLRQQQGHVNAHIVRHCSAQRGRDRVDVLLASNDNMKLKIEYPAITVTARMNDRLCLCGITDTMVLEGVLSAGERKARYGCVYSGPKAQIGRCSGSLRYALGGQISLLTPYLNRKGVS